MKWWDSKAYALQESFRQSEYNKSDDYSDEKCRRSLVYTREDVILIVSQLSSVNANLSGIKFRLTCVAAGIILILGIMIVQRN